MKLRIDELLVRLSLVTDIEIARKLILAGKVFADTKLIDKIGTQVKETANITIKKNKEHNWVSRGGLKLEKAIDYFSINIKDKIALDIGSSTGGFTEVLLYNGAKKVFAVDVGYGELDYKLRVDGRVVLYERTNARFLTREQIYEDIDVIVCDASFISLKTVLPKSFEFINLNSAYLVALIKPQFEAYREEVGEKGIIKDPDLHKAICEDIREWVKSCGWEVLDVIESPILGMKGNKEFLIGAKHNG